MLDRIELQAWHYGTGIGEFWDRRDIAPELRDLLDRPGGESSLRAAVDAELGTGWHLGLPALLAAVADLLERGRLTMERLQPEALVFDPHRLVGKGAENLGNLVDLAEGPANLPVEEPDHWIEIRLVDEAEQPIINERYRIDLPDGKSQEGHTDGAGIVRIDPIYKAGHCRVQFPDLVEQLAMAS